MKNWLLFLLVAASTGSSAQWTEMSPALKKRSETASVVYNGKIYTFLGFADSLLNVEPTVEVYDPTSDSWTLLASIDSLKSVTHQGVVLVDDNVWHIGGRVGKNPGPITHETWIYNITNNSWSQGPNIVDPANNSLIKWAGGGAALLGRTIHLFGGFVGTACDGDQSRYHLTLDVDDYLSNPATSWKNELAPMPMPRNHLGTAVMGGKIYAIGGQFGHDCGGGIDQNYSHEYNPVTDTWRELPMLPLPRSHAEGSTFVSDGKIYIVAGQSVGTNNRNSCDRVTTYDLYTDTWFEDSVNMKLPGKYEGLSAKIVDSKFVISHGGEGGSNFTRNTTFSRLVERDPLDTLVFTQDTAIVYVPAGDTAIRKTWLSSFDTKINFSINAPSEPWFKLIDSVGTATANASDVHFEINASALAQGTYYVTLNTSYTPADFLERSIKTVIAVNIIPLVSITTSPITVAEDASHAEFTISLDKTSFAPIKVDYVTEHVTTSAKDITLKSGTITFEPGINSQKLSIPLLADYIDEVDETFQLKLVNAKNAVIATSLVNGKLIDNDAVSTISAYDTGATESSLKALVRLSLNKPSGKSIRVYFDTKNVTAVSGTDYTGIAGGSVLFAAGETNKYVTVAIKNDNVQENTETFQLALRSPSNATISRATSTISIYNGSTTPGGQNVLEAESALVSGATIQKVNAGFTGSGYVDYVNASNDFIEWTINSATGGGFRLNFRYANGTTTNRPLQLKINGVTVIASMAFGPTGSWTSWSSGTTINANLVSGANKIRLTAIGSSGPNIDHLTFAQVPTTTLVEAEFAAISGGFIQKTHAGFTGSGYFDYENASNDYVEWTVNAPEAGAFNINFRYANGSSTNRSLQLLVNGTAINNSIAFERSGAWNNWINTPTISTNLVAGENKIRLTAIGQSGPNVDHINITSSSGSSAVTVTSTSLLEPIGDSRPSETGEFVKLLPNPVSGVGQLLFMSDANAAYRISVIHIDGRILKTITAPARSSSVSLPFTGFSAGLYIISVEQANRRQQIKAIVR